MLVEYGFTISNNQYDFLRRKKVTIETFHPTEQIQDEIRERYKERLAHLNMKEVLQLDLKINAVHRDALKMLRAYELAKCDVNDTEASWNKIEAEIVFKYGKWLETELLKYPTTLFEDEQRLAEV